MSEKPPEYDLTPEEPRPSKSEGASGTGSGLTGGAGEGGVRGAVPTGFVPPTPIVLGPDEKDPDEMDAEEHRVVAMLGYLVFLLPLVFAAKSKFARFHANQALLVFCSGAVLMVVLMGTWSAAVMVGMMPPALLAMVEPVKYVARCICLPVNCLFLVGVAFLALQGIINAANGEKKVLPVIGKLKLIKPVDK